MKSLVTFLFLFQFWSQKLFHTLSVVKLTRLYEEIINLGVDKMDYLFRTLC